MFVNINIDSSNVYKKCERKCINEIYFYIIDDYKNFCLLYNLL